MSPNEKVKEPDTDRRTFKDAWYGYICAPHTSHTLEAGRSRRLAQDVRIRILSNVNLTSLRRLIGVLGPGSEDAEYTLFCMGYMSYISTSQRNKLLSYFKVCSIVGDPGFSVCYSEAKRTCVLNISPGVLTKRASNGPWVDCDALLRQK